MGRWAHIEGAPAAERDRWEWLGDALLSEMAARLLLHRLLPSVSSTHPAVLDPLRLFRDAHDVMVCNKTLSSAFRSEDAPLGAGPVRGSRETKREADLVEAYIGKYFKDRRRLDAAMYDVMSTAMPEIQRPAPLMDPRSNSFECLVGREVQPQPAAAAPASEPEAVRQGLMQFYGGKLLGAAISLELFASLNRQSSASTLTLARQTVTKSSVQLAAFAAAREQAAREALHFANNPSDPLQHIGRTVAALLGHEATGAWRTALTTPQRLPRCFERSDLLAQAVWPGTAKAVWPGTAKALRFRPSVVVQRVRQQDAADLSSNKRATKRQRPARPANVLSSIKRFNHSLSKKEQTAIKRAADSEFVELLENLLLWLRAQQQPATPAEVSAMLRGEEVEAANPPLAMLAQLQTLLDQGATQADSQQCNWLEDDEQIRLPLPSSFHRLLTHSLCQYHGLQSQSAPGAVLVSGKKAHAPGTRPLPDTIPVEEMLRELNNREYND